MVWWLEVDVDEVVEEVVLVEVVLEENGALLVVAAGLHDSEALLNGPLIGNGIADTGVPGAAFTLKVNVWPLSSVTVTAHGSAEASGTAAIPFTASTVAPVATATVSFRHLNTGV